ncbi:MAG: hypothetical protein P8H33_02435 [Crocinitomicaceae bacterium]|nr:hypothetical protein [Crocinitomicaceae bacterium]
MKKISLIISIFFVNVVAMANLSVEGRYQGKNLYVQNPIDDEGFGYCATKVVVNGDIMPGAIGAGAFEIDFSLFNIELGEPVFIVIEHNEGCQPKILNPEVLLPSSTYNIVNITVSNAGKLAFTTKGEQGKLPFFIEQYKWNKWCVVGEVLGKGNGQQNSYDFVLTPHSGENTVRIVQVDHSGIKRPSKQVKFSAKSPVVKKTPAKVKNEIKFIANDVSIETGYEIYDAYGNLVKEGVGSSVDCSNLLRGVYYINFDNVTEKFIKN